MISNLDPQGAAGGAAGISASPPRDYFRQLLAGTPPHCNEAELLAWMQTADRARTLRLQDLMISAEELLRFHLDYLRMPATPERPWLSAFLLASAQKAYAGAPSSGQGPRTVYPVLQPLMAPPPPTVGPVLHLFQPPPPQAQAAGPLPAGLGPQEMAAIQSPSILAALQDSLTLQHGYCLRDARSLVRGLESFTCLLGIGLPFGRIRSQWPREGSPQASLVSVAGGRGACFPGYPWSGIYNVHGMLNDLRGHIDQPDVDRIFDALRDALAHHDREIVASDATFRALMAGDAASPAVTPERLLRALRCAYLRPRDERVALMEALAGALDVTLETGPRGRDELVYQLERGFFMEPGPMSEPRYALQMLACEPPPNMTHCDELLNLCLKHQASTARDLTRRD